MSVLVASAVFVILTNYVRGVASQVGPLTTVYQAATQIEAYAPLGEANLEPVEVPKRWASPASRLELTNLQNRRVGFRMKKGTVVTSDMLIPRSQLSRTEREVAINVDAVTGLAGRVRPGDRVDIYSVFSSVPGLTPQVRVLVRNVRVISIGGKQTITETTANGVAENEVVPVTMALEPANSLAVTYATSFAKEVRIVALPTDVGTDRSRDADSFDAGDLGGQPIPYGDPDQLPPAGEVVP